MQHPSLQQLLLDLNHPKRYEDELIHGPANGDVCDWLERYAEWPLSQNMIIGSAKSGKTTLMTLAKKKYSVFCLSPREQLFMPPVSALPSSDIFLDDAEKVPQEWLFHLINHQFLNGNKLTLLTVKSSQEWVCETKDLESRLKSFYPIEIQAMDETMALQLAHKLLLGRGINYDAQVIDYLLLRMDRTYAALFDVIAGLDRYLLNKHKRLTLPQLREFLKDINTSHLMD